MLTIDHPVESYIFQGPDEPSIGQHLVLGISLGGHSAWQVLFNEPRVIAAVIIIGCPDYMRKCCLSPPLNNPKYFNHTYEARSLTTTVNFRGEKYKQHMSKYQNSFPPIPQSQEISVSEWDEATK